MLSSYKNMVLVIQSQKYTITRFKTLIVIFIIL